MDAAGPPPPTAAPQAQPPMAASAPAALADWQPESWWALLAYLASGFGLFLVVSLLIQLAFRKQFNIFTSAALYGANFVCFGGTAYLLGVRRRRMSWAEFGLRPFNLAWLLLALGLALAVLPARGLAAVLAERLAGANFSDMQLRLDLIAPSGGPLALNFIITLVGAGLLAPLAEELFFRGLVQRWFSARFGFWPAVFISSAIFAAGHADSIGVVASSFVLGLVLAALYDRSRSLWLTIAVHATNNSAAVVLLYAALALPVKLR
jgi:membrane protease YdiL (CAAX protease family)